MENLNGSFFCIYCESLLRLPDEEPIVCVCGAVVPFSAFESVVVDYRSSPSPNPAWVNRRKKAAQKTTRATIDEACPECGHPELEYYTMQLRSADEGQTVFYECPNCGHKFSQNN